MGGHTFAIRLLNGSVVECIVTESDNVAPFLNRLDEKYGKRDKTLVVRLRDGYIMEPGVVKVAVLDVTIRRDTECCVAIDPHNDQRDRLCICDKPNGELVFIFTIDVLIAITDRVARVHITQKYNFNFLDTITPSYVFAVPDRAVLATLTVDVGQRVQLVAKIPSVYPFPSPVQLSRELELPSPKHVEIQLGKIFSDDHDATVHIEYVQELEDESPTSDCVLFCLPKTTTSCHRSANRTNSTTIGKLTVRSECSMTNRIVQVKSPSHKTLLVFNDTTDHKRATITLVDNVGCLQTDFIFAVHVDRKHYQSAIHEYNPDTNTHCIMYTNISHVLPDSRPTDIIFIVDCCTYMLDSKLAQVQEALAFSIRTLPKSCTINIVKFGISTHFKLFETSVNCDDDGIVRLLQAVNSLRADMGAGGMMDISRPLTDVYTMNKNSPSSTVILLIGTNHFDEQNVITDTTKAVNSQRQLRVFMLGIGIRDEYDTLDSIARAGWGYSQCIEEQGCIVAAVLLVLANAMQIRVNSIEWSSSNSIDVGRQSPSEILTVQSRPQQTVFCILPPHRIPESYINLVGLHADTQTTTQVPTRDIVNGNTLHALAIKDIYKRSATAEPEIAQIAMLCALSTKTNRFVVVDSNNPSTHTNAIMLFMDYSPITPTPVMCFEPDPDAELIDVPYYIRLMQDERMVPSGFRPISIPSPNVTFSRLDVQKLYNLVKH
ncbi:hypothetical protein BC938DRAFT_471076 [Jimgerdemannia flammicorona]|uniref:VWFA domain-containing protein n=1 Tax=Jimgerdemannia flammicorona TaxID=994334 RepID=A0A433Q8S2_9FUNG|nr:hypothetical protein BC938DRAFT_471076 [Jimgerdemannia flammicorona]